MSPKSMPQTVVPHVPTPAIVKTVAGDVELWHVQVLVAQAVGPNAVTQRQEGVAVAVVVRRALRSEDCKTVERSCAS